MKRLGLMLALIFLSSAPIWAAPKNEKQPTLTPLLSRRLGANDSAMIAAPGGKILAAVHADTPLVPASILKVLTSLAAMHYLGEGYRFPTDFFITPANDLKIKGYGDPAMISERIAEIAGQLAERSRRFNRLILDDSYFTQPLTIPGRSLTNEPYDAPNGALCANFNTVNFKRENGRWVSAEEQTPLLPYLVPRIKAARLKAGRITLAGTSEEGLRYTGELFRYFLNQAGVEGMMDMAPGLVEPQTDQLLLRYESPEPLTAVIAGLLDHSNNFTANQLLLAMGAKTFGPPATLEKGVQALSDYYHKVLKLNGAVFLEGSGLSHENRITARDMLRIIERFAAHRDLLRHEERQWYKTGTLYGVSTRVGFLESRHGEPYRFVVMVNTPGRSAERIMQIIEKYLE